MSGSMWFGADAVYKRVVVRAAERMMLWREMRETRDRSNRRAVGLSGISRRVSRGCRRVVLCCGRGAWAGGRTPDGSERHCVSRVEQL